MHTDPYSIIFQNLSLVARALFEGMPIARWSACIRLLLAAFTGSASSFLDPNPFLADLDVGLYVLFWLVRIRGCVRRGDQPLLRGPEWFCDVRVRADFHAGAGRKILHRYWVRMFIPFVLDIPLATVIFLTGRLSLLT